MNTCSFPSKTLESEGDSRGGGEQGGRAKNTQQQANHQIGENCAPKKESLRAGSLGRENRKAL